MCLVCTLEYEIFCEIRSMKIHVFWIMTPGRMLSRYHSVMIISNMVPFIH